LPISTNEGPTLIERQLRKGAVADLAAITFNNFIEREKHWLGHMRPPCRPDISGTKVERYLPAVSLRPVAEVQVESSPSDVRRSPDPATASRSSIVVPSLDALCALNKLLN
jgi:hypothetical protein